VDAGKGMRGRPLSLDRCLATEKFDCSQMLTIDQQGSGGAGISPDESNRNAEGESIELINQLIGGSANSASGFDFGWGW
jgi:hypothetical protein